MELVKKMGISERLQEERKDLGLTQEAMTGKLGATKRSVINWEGGAALPGAEVLAGYAAAGADVLYILTGQRSQPVPPAQELPRQEQEWLALYRNSSEEVRAALKAAGNELTKPARARGKAA